MGQAQSALLVDAEESQEQYSLPENGGVLVFGQSLLSSEGTIVLENETIIQISTYCAHSAFVCESGRVFTAGDNLGGQLGLGCSGFSVALPNVVSALEDHRVIQAACGDCFTLFLTDEGTVFSCGMNQDGQLGLGYHKDQATPTPIRNIPAIKLISAGYSHCAALSVSGSVYVWGSNSHGQLGLSEENKRNAPTLLVTLDLVSSISCGYLQTAFVTEQGAVWKCGRCKSGVMEVMGEQEEVVETPTVLDIPTPVVSVAIGEEHCLALTGEGEVWAWGDNWYGQIGPKETVSRAIPAQLPLGRKVVQVSAECSQSALVTVDGCLLTMGLDENGQLCHSEHCNRDIPMPVHQLAHLFVMQVVCGTSHTMVLVRPRTAQEIQAMIELQLTVKTTEKVKESKVELEKQGEKVEKREWEERLKVWDQKLKKRLQRIEEREQKLGDWEERLKLREERVEEGEKKLKEWEERLKYREERLCEIRFQIHEKNCMKMLETDC